MRLVERQRARGLVKVELLKIVCSLLSAPPQNETPGVRERLDERHVFTAFGSFSSSDFHGNYGAGNWMRVRHDGFAQHDW